MAHARSLRLRLPTATTARRARRLHSPDGHRPARGADRGPPHGSELKFREDANRGVWEAIVGAGPVVPVPATAEDVDAYISAWNELLVELTR
jgi:hypothetical protein